MIQKREWCGIPFMAVADEKARTAFLLWNCSAATMTNVMATILSLLPCRMARLDAV